MNYYRFGRALLPEGGLFDTIDAAIEFTEAEEVDVLAEQIRNLSFTTDEEGLLMVLINNKRFLITQSALKDLCKIFKVPAGYINKFPGRTLVLENLNNNPYLIDNSDMLKLVIWASEEYPVIAGVLPGEDAAMTMKEYLSMLKDGGVFERESVKLDQIAITGEEIVLYFYFPQEIAQNGFTYSGGYAIHYSPTRLVDTVIYPFCKMAIVASTGEPFDFDFESSKKLHVIKRKKEDFLNNTLEVSQHYAGEDLGSYYEEAIKYGTVSGNLDTVKYALLKYFRSRAVSTYNYSGLKVDGNIVAQEVIPEYKEFYSANSEQLKEMETYSANNLPVSFYLPVFFNRIFTFQSSIESAYFLIRYRKGIGTMLNKLLDEVGDVVVDTSMKAPSENGPSA